VQAFLKRETLDCERRNPMRKITPNVWYDHEAEEAANFYTSIFKD
jgi:3-demethylubiquinone-9 3-methyltransferase